MSETRTKARDRDGARAEVERLRAEVKRLKSAVLCACVGATYSFDPGRNVLGERVGYSITAGLGCPACGGRGVAVGSGAE